MNSRPPPFSGITQFIPGLALFREMNATRFRSQFVVAITVFAASVPWRR